jgi:hypothetical protein
MKSLSHLSCVRRWLVRVLAGLVVVVVLVAASLYAYGGMHTLGGVLRGESIVWVSVAADDPRLSASMRLALRNRTVGATAGAFAWRMIAPGFEVADLPVMAAGAEVDRIALARVDPARFRFIVRTATAGDRKLDDWMQALGAALVINGSYFARDGVPSTPLVSAGLRMGPDDYPATHGAIVASGGSVRIRDLAATDWHTALRGADDAMVSFPLLFAADGANRVKADWRWLANRSFVAEDRAGRIVFGTTADAFFSLERLADFLRGAPLDLVLALNLDGGPVASQGVALNGYRRRACGQWELATMHDQLKSLTPLFGTRARCWGMPIVLAVLPK